MLRAGTGRPVPPSAPVSWPHGLSQDPGAVHQARRKCPCPFFPLTSGENLGAVGCFWPWGASGPSRARAASAGIVVSSSAASPSEGTSSDSCLTFSAGGGPAGLSGRLAAQGLVGTCSPLRLASPLLGAQSATPVLQAQGAPGGVTLLPISFQEGRRASDTSLTQGDQPSLLPFHLSQKVLGGCHPVPVQMACAESLAGPGRSSGAPRL